MRAMFARPPARPRLRAAFAAAALVVSLAPFGAAAQEAPARSLTDSATAAVRDAAAGAWDVARNLTTSALDLIGIRYRWGGATPATGLDCSGLVQFVFQQATGVTLPRSAKEQSRLGEHVGLADLKPGDLVFFNTRRFAFSHVGIYLGDNRFVHAPRRGREVEVASIEAGYWQRRFDGARRLVGVLPELVPSLVSEAVAAAAEPPAAEGSPAGTADLDP
jgi:cell wall-associated NlpC family hydrolase